MLLTEKRLGMRVSLRNGLIFGFASVALIFLFVFVGNMIWYRVSNVVLRLAAVTLLLLALATLIQVLYLLLVHRYRINI